MLNNLDRDIHGCVRSQVLDIAMSGVFVFCSSSDLAYLTVREEQSPALRVSDCFSHGVYNWR